MPIATAKLWQLCSQLYGVHRTGVYGRPCIRHLINAHRDGNFVGGISSTSSVRQSPAKSIGKARHQTRYGGVGVIRIGDDDAIGVATDQLPQARAHRRGRGIHDRRLILAGVEIGPCICLIGGYLAERYRSRNGELGLTAV